MERKEIAKARKEFRCEGGHLWFMTNTQGLVEVKCRYCAKRKSRELGYRVVVFHYFDVQRGTQVATKIYRDARDLVGCGDNMHKRPL